MEYIKNYDNYNECLLIEKLNIKNLLDTFKLYNNRKTANFIVASILAVMTVTQTVDFIHKLNLDEPQKTTLIKVVYRFRNPLSFGISTAGYEHIVGHEKLRLKAYNIGDGHITIGYGHAEPISKSKYRVGQTITEEEADKLLKEDLVTASEGIKRMFSDWEKRGTHLKITQSQFDVLVSMAFNMGVSGLRNSEFIEKLEKDGINTASELIKTTGLRDGFAGLESRREIEYNMFIS